MGLMKKSSAKNQRVVLKIRCVPEDSNTSMGQIYSFIGIFLTGFLPDLCR